MIEKLEKELEIFKSRHETAIQEIGRLESRLQTQHLDSKNDSEILNSEIQKREDQIYRIKIDKEKLKEQSTSLEDKLKDYEIVIGNLKQQSVSLQCSSKSKEENIYKLENQLEDCKTKLNQVNEDYLRLEDKYKLSLDDFNNLQNVKNDLENKVFIEFFIICFIIEMNKKTLE